MAGANVTVSGMPREMGGLKESQVAFMKHHKEVADALLNISGIGTIDGKPHDKDDPRPPYVHQDWPKMVYHAEHGELVVEDQHELDEALRQRYRPEPYLKPQVALADPRAEKFALQKELKEKDGQITTLADQMRRMQDQMTEMAAKLEAIPAASKK
jgi:hypothetical protein